MPSRRAAAWVASITIHLLAVHVISRASWPAIEEVGAPDSTVVWLEDWPLPDMREEAALELQSEVEPQPEIETESAAEPEPEVEPEEDIPPDAEPREEPAREEIPPEEIASSDLTRPAEQIEASAPDDEAASDAIDEPSAPETAPAEGQRRSRNIIVREVDWDEERRRAVEQVARTQRDSTFSASDRVEEETVAQASSADGIFEASGSGRSRGLLKPGRSGGPIGRRITALCDVLGGIGLFGVSSLCAQPGERAALFADIKPAYLRSRPECTEVPGAEAPQGIDAGRGDPTVKCRLVPEDGQRPPDEAMADLPDFEQGSAVPVEASRALEAEASDDILAGSLEPAAAEPVVPASDAVGNAP